MIPSIKFPSLSRIKALRLLTLLSFFHFSGINNGLTIMVVGVQSVQYVSFTPVLVQGVGHAINPFCWKAVLSTRGLQGMVFRSRRTLRVSSQGAIRRFHPYQIVTGVRGWGLGVGGHPNTYGVNRHSRVKRGNPAIFKGSPFTIHYSPSTAVITSKSPAAWRRMDRQEPGRKIRLEIFNFGLMSGHPQNSIKINQILERQASLPHGAQQMLWRLTRKAGWEEDPAKILARHSRPPDVWRRNPVQ